MSHGVVHFEIPADDAAKLSKFYADLFDWQIQKMPMGDVDYFMASTVETDDQGMPREPGAINGGITARMSPDLIRSPSTTSRSSRWTTTPPRR